MSNWHNAYESAMLQNSDAAQIAAARALAMQNIRELPFVCARCERSSLVRVGISGGLVSCGHCGLQCDLLLIPANGYRTEHYRIGPVG